MTTESKTEELSSTQQDVLRACEQVIEKTQRSFVECGNALAKIRDERLYRTSHDNFETYCQERWGWGRARAAQLIEAASVVSDLPKKLLTIVNNEGQARALAAVPEEDRKAVMQAVKESKEPVTAKAIEAAAEKIVEPAKPAPKPDKKAEVVVECDRFGHEIPADVFVDWQRAEQVQERLTQLSQIKSLVKKGLDDKDVIFAELSNSLEATLGNAYGDLKRVLPWTICPTCSARKASRTKCLLCKQRGWLSEFLFKTALPDEIKKMWCKNKKQ
jgi:hypothetical protein